MDVLIFHHFLSLYMLTPEASMAGWIRSICRSGMREKEWIWRCVGRLIHLISVDARKVGPFLDS